MSTNKEIVKSASIIGLFTLCSRILGFIRDIVIARLFGTYALAQAFVVAFRIPNLFRDMVAEGACNSAFVPVFSEYSKKKSKEEFWHLANCLLNILLVILSVITILGISFAPLIVRIIAPGFISEPDKLAETIKLTRIIYPYILLIGLYAYCMGLLNSLKHFSLPALAPCFLNISIIVFAIIFGEGTIGLALGVLVGGVFQLALQIPILYKKGFRYKMIFEYKHPGIRQIGRLIVPRIFSSCIYQLNVFVDTILSSLSNIVGAGGVAALYYANRIFQFPLGIFGVAIAQAALPTMSHQALEDNLDNFKETLVFSIISVFIVMLPVTTLLIILNSPIVELLFQRGRFDMYSTSLTSGAILFYSFGLAAYAANKVLVSGFFSLKDTRTPLKVASISLFINILFNVMLMYPFKLKGLALATTISGVFNFFALLYLLRKKIGCIQGRYLFKSFVKIIISCIFMGLIVFYLYNFLNNQTLLLRIFVSSFFGSVAFILSCILMGLTELIRLFRWILRKK